MYNHSNVSQFCINCDTFMYFSKTFENIYFKNFYEQFNFYLFNYTTFFKKKNSFYTLFFWKFRCCDTEVIYNH